MPSPGLGRPYASVLDTNTLGRGRGDKDSLRGQVIPLPSVEAPARLSKPRTSITLKRKEMHALIFSFKAGNVFDNACGDLHRQMSM